MNNNIDQLRTEVDDIKNSLNELKNNVSLSEDEKKEQVDALKSQAEATKKKIEDEISSLEGKTDDESKKQKEEAETLLNSFNEIMSLYASILNSQESEEPEEEQQEEKKGFFKRTKEWVWEQWDDIWDKEKWKEEKWKNLLRTAWFAVTWIWTVALAVKWVKKLWNWAFWDKDEEGSEEDTEKKSKDKKEKKKKKKERREERRKKRKERKENRPWRQKFLIWSAVAWWTVVWWVQIYKHRNRISSWFKEKLWLALSFDEARQKVENEVRNWKVDADHFGAFNTNFEWWITYDDNTQEICSYDQKTKIDKKNKKLEWLDIEFSSYEELIHAANIVNFAKRKLRWRWATSTPFIKTDWWWDIAFNCSVNWKKEFMSANGSNEWAWILWTLWTAGGWILGSYCGWVKWAAIWSVSWWAAWYALWSYIDNTSTAGRCCGTISRWKNLDGFINYLNRQTDENWKSLWESAWEQRIDPNDTPINWVIDNWETDRSKRDWVLADIEKSYWEDQTWRRNLEILWDETNPNNYVIKSYGHECKMTIGWLPSKRWEQVDYSKITKIHIEKYNDNDWWDWLDVDFPHTEDWLKEAIRVANLTNMIVEDRSWKWWEEYPFDYGKYKTPFSFEIDVSWMWTNYMWWTTILNHDTLKEKYPTLHKDLTEFPSSKSAFSSVNKFQKQMHKQAIDDESTWSQYIKFLHQMRASNWGQLWKKVW